MVHMTRHTFTVRLVNDGWTDNVDTFYAECSCGIASGMGHATAESARREPMHAHRGYVPAYDGRIIR